jgi:hypothetical protein
MDEKTFEVERVTQVELAGDEARNGHGASTDQRKDVVFLQRISDEDAGTG